MARPWLAKRLDELKATGKSRTGLARHLGLAPARITEMIDGARAIQTTEILPIAEYLGMTYSELLALELGPEFVPTPASDTIMVVGAVEAGIFRPALEFPPDEQKAVAIYSFPNFERLRKFGLLVRGRSMDQVYRPGTILICVRVAEGMIQITPGMRVIVCRRDDSGDIEATVKELVEDGEGGLWLWPRSTDPAHQQPWRLPQHHSDDCSDDQLWIEAVVIGSQQPEF